MGVFDSGTKTQASERLVNERNEEIENNAERKRETLALVTRSHGFFERTHSIYTPQIIEHDNSAWQPTKTTIFVENFLPSNLL